VVILKELKRLADAGDATAQVVVTMAITTMAIMTVMGMIMGPGAIRGLQATAKHQRRSLRGRTARSNDDGASNGKLCRGWSASIFV
jgi:hypothetical protein